MSPPRHLGTSRSERIVRLCEELGLDDAPKALRSTADRFRAAGAQGAASDRLGAIVGYVLTGCGGGRLLLRPDHPDHAPYPGIRAHLHRIGASDACRWAKRKSDPAMAPLLT